MFANIVVDGVLEFLNALEDATPDTLVGDFGEPTFDEVQPGRTGGREVHVEPWMLGEPCLHLGMFVRGVVVGDDVES